MMEDLELRSEAEIDMERLAREARSSEHGEAYQPMGKLDDTRIGVGARFIPPDEIEYFIEVVVPVASGSLVDLDRLYGRLKVLRGLEERGFSITFQEESCFCCELTTKSEDLEGEYERAISIVAWL